MLSQETRKTHKTLIEIKTATITKKGQIAIPIDIRKASGFKKGSKITVLSYDDHIELRPMKQIESSLENLDEKYNLLLASERVLAKDWNTKEEDEAWKDL
ncbi:MAG: AbrB/MazE/SpoVT family DNA-binding domain-containing protein [Candidatus Aenigmarchaeota archaeon]|nr:AbrB/MazE/SpoVT family DNA-binding domain-containing protein [Candidatus Aenigmarchaeota archaeon]